MPALRERGRIRAPSCSSSILTFQILTAKCLCHERLQEEYIDSEKHSWAVSRVRLLQKGHRVRTAHNSLSAHPASAVLYQDGDWAVVLFTPLSGASGSSFCIRNTTSKLVPLWSTGKAFLVLTLEIQISGPSVRLAKLGPLALWLRHWHI